MSFVRVLYVEKKRFIEYECDQCGLLYKKTYTKSEVNSTKNSFCSRSCYFQSLQKGGITNVKMTRTNVEKYGVEYPCQSSEIKDHRKETCLERFGVDNPTKSNLIKENMRRKSQEIYKTDYPSQSKEIREKIKATCIKKYDKQKSTRKTPIDDINKKTKETCLKKYGVDNVFQLESTKEKRKITWIQKYGVDHPFKSDIVKSKIDHSEISKKIKVTCLEKYGVDNPFKSNTVKSKIDYKALCKKSHETMKRNGTYGKSKSEDKFYEFLCEKFGEENIERQVRMNKQSIDFYIIILDLYIQFDGVYWHGLDRHIEMIKVSNGKRDQAIYSKWVKDRKLDEYMKKENKKLIRITDKEFLKLNENCSNVFNIKNLLISSHKS